MCICLCFPVAACTGSIPDRWEPLPRPVHPTVGAAAARPLHLTAPAGSELPPPPPRLPHPRGLETSDSSRALGIHISITALFEVGGGVDTCRGLRVCQSQPSAPPQPRCWGVGWGCAIERSAPAQLLPPFQPLLLQEARRKRAHSAAGVSPTY